eukprot:Partr_v1_DN27442_c3_g1_i1_m71832 putative Rna-binding protein
MLSTPNHISMALFSTYVLLGNLLFCDHIDSVSAVDDMLQTFYRTKIASTFADAESFIDSQQLESLVPRDIFSTPSLHSKTIPPGLENIRRYNSIPLAPETHSEKINAVSATASTTIPWSQHSLTTGRTKEEALKISSAFNENKYAIADRNVPTENRLQVDRIRAGLDKRTTFMIRNIPNKYSQQMLIDMVNDTHKGRFDFLYLRMDFRNKCNVGYAFINFPNPVDAVTFASRVCGKKWKKFNSEKVCTMSYASIQGVEALISKFRDSQVMDEKESYRPKLFDSNGQEIPFPSPTKLRSPHPRWRASETMESEAAKHVDKHFSNISFDST